MSDSGKQDRIEELLRKSLLGEELVNTQFHLYSARSSPSRRVLKPRALCANNVLLAKSSKYFLDLLSSDVNPSDSSLIDLTDDRDVQSNAQIDDYGYGSDSDLDECNDPVPVSHPEAPKSRSASKDDDEVSDDGSVSSDMFVMSPEQPREDGLPFSALKDGGARSEMSSETAVHDRAAAGNKQTSSRNQTAMRLRSLGSRHVLVKDTAFQTWYTLLNYLYTDKFSFLPLSSATPGGHPRASSTSALDEPRCSAKSMYRLASKVGLDDLRDEAFAYIRSNLTEHNILQELSCSIVSTHPELLEMELDVLYAHIGTAHVVANFPALARRIANRELPHGADIVIGIHTRLLKEPWALPLKRATRTAHVCRVLPAGEPVHGDGSVCYASEVGIGDEEILPAPLWSSTQSKPTVSSFTFGEEKTDARPASGVNAFSGFINNGMAVPPTPCSPPLSMSSSKQSKGAPRVNGAKRQ